MEEKLEQFSETVGELTDKAENLQEDAKSEFHKQIESLHAKQGTVRAKLEKLEDAGDDALDDLKEGIEEAWKDLKRALDSAISRFKSDSDKHIEGESQ